MTIPASDVDALFDLIEAEAKKLRETNPDHELLEFIGPVMGTEQWTTKVGEKFLTMFDTDGKKTVITIRVAYYQALMEENKPSAS